MKLEQFKEAKFIVAEIEQHQSILDRLELDDLRVEVKASAVRNMPAVDRQICSLYYSEKDLQEVFDAVKKCVQNKVDSLTKKLEAIK